MKTLDEVIESLEKGEPSFGGALHYLKKYRDAQKTRLYRDCPLGIHEEEEK